MSLEQSSPTNARADKKAKKEISFTEKIFEEAKEKFDKEVAAAKNVKEVKTLFHVHLKEVLSSFERRMKDWTKTLFDSHAEDMETDITSAQSELTKVRESVEKLATNDAKNTNTVTELQNSAKKQTEMVKQLTENGSALTEPQQMYQRRNSIRIFGVPEENEENTTSKALDLFRNKLDLDLWSERDVDRSHRVGISSNGRPRAILLKFLRHTDKEAVIRARRKLKGTGIVIREDLTKTRMDWIRALRNHLDSRSIWSNDGTIVAYFNNQKNFIRNPHDLQAVLALLREA